MNLSWFIASRLKFRGKIVSASIAVSFLIMIVAVSVSSGFRQEIRNGISSAAGDVQLTPPDLNVLNEGAPVEFDVAYISRIRQLDYVSEIRPAAYRAGIVKEGENIHGVLFKGCEGIFSDSLALPVSIPERLAEITGLESGDKMTAYFVGNTVKARKFNIVGVHKAMLKTDDKLVVYASLGDIQRLNGWDSTQVSAVEVILDDKSVNAMSEASQQIGTIVNAYSTDSSHPVIATSAVSRYRQLFDWLNLIDFNVMFILILMTIVAGFNMISGLLIILFENTSAIGLLKSLGMKDRSIASVFLAGAASFVFKGMAAGNAIALIFCLIQKKFQFLKLDPDNYFVSFVPVNIDWGMILLCDLVSFAAIMLFLLIPCLFISKVDPAKTVRYS